MSEEEIYKVEASQDEAANADLRQALHRWSAPEVSESFDNRMFALYRKEFSENLEGNSLSTNRAGEASIYAANLASNQFQNQDTAQYMQTGEEVKMKHCSKCQKDFADTFSFCPTDGTPLLNVAGEINGALSNDATNNAMGDYDEAVTVGRANPFIGENIPVTARRNVHAMANDATSQSDVNHAAMNGNAANIAAGAAALAAANNAYGARETAASAESNALPLHSEYHLTIIEDTGIVRRLGNEFRGVAQASRLTYPEFKRDPAGFSKRVVTGYSTLAWNTFKQPNVATATISAVLGMCLIIGLVFALGNFRPLQVADNPNKDLEYIGDFQDIPDEQPTPEPKPEKEGASGNAKGTGGGSKPEPIKAQGGGGGGREDPIPASRGKLPIASLQPQVLAPEPNPPKIMNPSLPTVPTIRAEPLLFPTDNRALPYGVKNGGDIASSGSGRGGGIGTGTGGGVGVGEGSGVGAGRGYNTGGGDAREGGGGAGGDGVDYNKIFNQKEVTSRAVVLSTPEPPYTEEARKNQIQGKVRLRVVLGANGQVSNIAPVVKLPYGLTEQAIAAARKINFRPAMKNGRPVSQYSYIEFAFNMY